MKKRLKSRLPTPRIQRKPRKRQRSKSGSDAKRDLMPLERQLRKKWL